MLQMENCNTTDEEIDIQLMGNCNTVDEEIDIQQKRDYRATNRKTNLHRWETMK